MTTPNTPLVSVVIPAYNAERFVGKTIESILLQTYPHFEVLVVDDGSTDSTAGIVKSFAVHDSRVKLLQKPNGGVATARNMGIRNATGEYVAPCDSDDVWYPDRLKAQVECMIQSDESVGLVYCWSKIIDEDDRPIVDITHSYEGRVFADLVYSNFLGNGSCALIRRRCFDAVGEYNGATTPCEEWDLYIRVAERYKVRLVPNILVGYREVLTSLSANHYRMEGAFASLLKEIKHRHPHIPNPILRVAKGSYYLYLTGKSNRRSRYGTSLRYLGISLFSDPLRFFSSEFHSTLAKAILRFLAHPVTSRIWKDDRMWRTMRRKLHAPATTQEHGEAENKRTPATAAPLRLFDRLHNSRMKRFRDEANAVLSADGHRTSGQ
ncbi:MAG: glycosyltransferase family 2 protein [Bacteroidetes bacterium]|nr:glycosyltransferase family 2 protein [Bacteroidota bacterium]MCW5897419.1 glycosyltransferase family 2 protein [Bacteroidota bacterium]